MARTLTPHVDSPPTPLEILCRLAGRSSWVMPTTGGSGRGVGSAVDIAHALGCVSDPLGQAVAAAIACGSLAEQRRIVELSNLPLLAELRAHWQTKDLVAGPARFRVRIVLADALANLVGVHHRRRRVLGMRRTTYYRLYPHAVAYLDNAARTAATEAVRRLFG